MEIINLSKKQVLATQCRLANTFLKRAIGLLNRSSLPHGEGLLLDNCHGVSTLGLRFPIDVIFLDSSLRVIRQVSFVKPFRIGPAARQAVYVLELPAGTIQQTQTEVGDQIQFRAKAENSANAIENRETSLAPIGTDGDREDNRDGSAGPSRLA
jgi:hypothetical protein